MDTFQKLQQNMDRFVDERDWNQFHKPKNLAMSIAIEAAELMEVFQWMSNDEAVEKTLNDEDIRNQVKDEIADVIIYCLSMANCTGIDLKKAIEDKMRRNDERFPPMRR